MDKFEEFQSTLAKSNEVFSTFRQEMEKVSLERTAVCVYTHAHVHSLLVICVSSDDQEDQKVGKRDDTVEEQVGEQQPGPAADGRGGEHLSFDSWKR